MQPKLSGDDFSEISQRTSLVLYAVDLKQWDRLRDSFTEDAVYDGRQTKTGLMVSGIQAMTDLWSSYPKMAIHYGTDLVISDYDPVNKTAKSMTKWIGTIDAQEMITGYYTDNWVMTDDGWRITHRTSVAVYAPDAVPRH
jgi:hypothetical protein